MTSITQRSPLLMRAAFTDEDANPVVPTTVEWKLNDLTNNNEILDWATLTPGSSISWVIPATNNQLVDPNNLKEIRAVSVRIDLGLATEAHGEFRYAILNQGPSVES